MKIPINDYLRLRKKERKTGSEQWAVGDKGENL